MNFEVTIQNITNGSTETFFVKAYSATDAASDKAKARIEKKEHPLHWRIRRIKPETQSLLKSDNVTTFEAE